MISATVSAANVKATELVEVTQAGETVIVTSDRQGVAETGDAQSVQRLGFLEHLNLDFPDSFFFDPMPEEELRLWEGGDDTQV